ncbi:MAG: hypothetical protein HZA69_05270 [Gammaproteobacteria bacterium]|nr:hypothetical protein [Gammaproteobacteria bacterium]
MSWILLALGLYVYERIGLAAAAIPFGIGGYLRRHHDKQLRDILFANRAWKAFTVIYYLGLLIVSFLYADSLMRLEMVLFVAVICFPFLLAVLINDVLTCVRYLQS